MRKTLIAAGIAAAALIPSFALAQSSCDQRHDNRVVGTVAGAGIGALAGSAIAGRGDHTTGALIGGGVGALIGNQATRSNQDCAHAYGYYDDRGQWRANAVERSSATGYYDRRGQWVDGAPSGYQEARGNQDASGYRDDRGGSSGRSGEQRDVRSRIAFMDDRIRRGVDNGSLSQRAGARALRSLAEIRRDERNMDHRGGRMGRRDEARLQARLDDLKDGLRWSGRDGTRND